MVSGISTVNCSINYWLMIFYIAKTVKQAYVEQKNPMRRKVKKQSISYLATYKFFKKTL